MVFKKFDLNRLDAIIAIYFLGGAFACYVANMVMSIMGNDWEGTWAALDFFGAALGFTIAGAICLILAVVLLYRNSQFTESTGKATSDDTVRMQIMGCIAVTIIMAALSMLIPAIV